MRSILQILSIFCVFVTCAQAEVIRIGDAASVPDPSRFDPKYPQMAEWAKAGVRGGIPPRQASRIVERVSPGQDIQAALDRVWTHGLSPSSGLSV